MRTDWHVWHGAGAMSTVYCGQQTAYHFRWAKVLQVCCHEALAAQALLYAGCQLRPHSLYGLNTRRGAVCLAPSPPRLPWCWQRTLVAMHLWGQMQHGPSALREWGPQAITTRIVYSTSCVHAADPCHAASRSTPGLVSLSLRMCRHSVE